MWSRTSDAIIKSDSIEAAVEAYFQRFKSSTKAWSFCLYTSLFAAAALSAWAGVLPQLDSRAKDIATVLAVTASLINTITAIGRFDQKWQASRKARSDVEKLHIMMLVKKDKSEIGEQLGQIINNQSAGVIGLHSLSDDGSRSEDQPGRPGNATGQSEQKHGQVEQQPEHGGSGT
jgi:hypothetical protein